MKTYLGLFILLLLGTACSSPRGFYTYRVVNVPGAEEGTVYVESSGLSGNEKDAYNDAAFNAFNTILFKGLPGSAQNVPLIDDEEKAKKQHPDVIACFKTFECYNKFIVETEKPGMPKKETNGISVTLRTKINLRSLRTYLEQNNVIRKFGF